MPASSVLERLVVEIIGDTGKLKTALAEAQRLTTEFTSKTKATATIGASGTGFRKAAADATEAQKAITGLRTGLDLLIADQKLGNVTTTEYAAGLRKIASGAQEASREFTLTSRQLKDLAGIATTAAREESTLGRASADVKAQVAQLSNEVRVLRNNWQRTGADTEAVKARLKQLADQAGVLQKELLATDGGFEKFNAEIARLATAGRSAEATIAGIENRMSRLGLASQVNLATTQALSMEMYRFGPLGMVMAGGVQNAAGALTAMGVGATAAAAGVGAMGLASYALIRKGIPEVEKFQSALQLLAATGNQISQGDLTRALDDAAAAAGKAGTQFSRAELATGLARLVKAGLDLNSALKLLPASMQLAIESDQSFQSASTLLLTNLREFGMGANEASRAAGALGVASLRARDNAQGLSEGLATVGPLAKQAGLSFEETLGALVTLSNTGLNAADMGSRALRTDITHLLNVTGPAQKALDKLGVATKDAAGHQRSMSAILADLIKAAHDMGVSFDQSTGQVVGSRDAIALLAQIVQQRGVVALASLAGQADNATNSWQANTNAIQHNSESLKDYADTLLTNNIGATQKALDTATKNLAEAFTLALAPAIATTEQAWAQWINTLTGMHTPTFNLVGDVNDLTKALAGVKTAADLQGVLDDLDSKLTGAAKDAFDKWRGSINLTTASLKDVIKYIKQTGVEGTKALALQDLQSKGTLGALQTLSPHEMNVFGAHLFGGKDAQALASQLSNLIGQGNFSQAAYVLSTAMSQALKNGQSFNSHDWSALENLLTVLETGNGQNVQARIDAAKNSPANNPNGTGTGTTPAPIPSAAELAKAQQLYEDQVLALAHKDTMAYAKAHAAITDWLNANGDKYDQETRQAAMSAVRAILGSATSGAKQAAKDAEAIANATTATKLRQEQPVRTDQVGLRVGYNPTATVADLIALNRWAAGQASLGTATVLGAPRYVPAAGALARSQFEDTLRAATQESAFRHQAYVGAQQLKGVATGALSLYQDAESAGKKLGGWILDGVHAVQKEALRQSTKRYQQQAVADFETALKIATQESAFRHQAYVGSQQLEGVAKGALGAYEGAVGAGKQLGAAFLHGLHWVQQQAAAQGNYVPGVNHSGLLPEFSGWTPEDFNKFVFGNGGSTGSGTTDKATESLKSLASAAQQVSQAFSGFESGLKAFSQGDVGAGVSGIASGIGTGLGAIGGLVGDATLGPIGVLVGVFGGLFGGLVDAISGNTQAVKQNTEAMLANVPTGFKVAGYAFNAAQPVNVTQHVTIQSNNPDKIYAELKRRMQRDTYLRTGSTVGAT